MKTTAKNTKVETVQSILKVQKLLKRWRGRAKRILHAGHVTAAREIFDCEKDLENAIRIRKARP